MSRRQLWTLLVLGLAAWIGAALTLPAVVAHAGLWGLAGNIVVGMSGCASVLVAGRRLVAGPGQQPRMETGQRRADRSPGRPHH